MRIIVNSGGQNYGWYTVEEVREYLASGSFQGNDFAWLENGTSWVTVSEALAKVPKSAEATTPGAAQAPRAIRTDKTVKLRIPRPAAPVEKKRTTLLLTGERKAAGLWKSFGH